MCLFRHSLLWVLLLASVGCLPDASVVAVAQTGKAGPDGPHVFYRGKKIVVKSVVSNEGKLAVKKSVYRQPQDVLLTCEVPATGDAFFFGLKDSIVLSNPILAQTPKKMLVLSDIEGNFKAMKTMLLGAKVIDEQFHWIYGKGHLVLLGDYFDRGQQVTECLWLAYKLEQEAQQAGGAVHFILGNHEIMNMAGDWRYVPQKYFDNADLMEEPYAGWYDNDSELGRWLRSKNTIEKIGPFLFCHGGISPEMVQSRLGIEDINRIARRWFGKPTSAISDPDAALIYNGNHGVYWYRDMARQKADPADVEAALAKYDARHIVIGHTLTQDLKLIYDGKVVCVDLYHEENLRQGFMKTLLIENGQMFGLDSRGEKTSLALVAQK